MKFLLLGGNRGRDEFGRRLLTRTALCGTQVSCLAADGVDRQTMKLAAIR
jgi:hypothetical protein